MVNIQTKQSNPRVAMVLARFYPVLGGTEKQALLLAKQLLREGVELFVVTARLPGQKSYEEIETVKIYRTASFFTGLSGSLLFMFSAFIFLWRRRYHFDLIHVFLAGSPALLALFAGKLLRKKVLLKFGGAGPTGDIGTSRSSLPGKIKLRLLKTKISAYIVPTQEIGDEIRQQGFSPDRIRLITNGVDLEKYAPVPVAEKIRLRQELKLPSQALVLSAGRLEKGKGVDVLLTCWPSVCQHFPEAHLLVLGEGTLRHELETMAVGLPCRDQVHFLRVVNEISGYLQSADLFVLPSLAEGLSNVLLEAMACGLPVVAADLPGNKELITNNVHGILTRAGVSASLSAGILSLLGDQSRQEALGRKARERAAAYSIELIAKEYKKLYQTLA
ncbi:MAG: glycosyltransferase family 4 protein [bacterium]|nr:glycosyltransferase family 4 protein [bacterium]